MKKIWHSWLAAIITINTIVFVGQIVVFALVKVYTHWGLNGPIGSRIFFVVLVVWLVLMFSVSVHYSRKNKRVLNRAQLWQNEWDIGYEMMEADESILDEKTGYIKFNNRIKYWWVMINLINVIVALIFAIVLQVA